MTACGREEQRFCAPRSECSAGETRTDKHREARTHTRTNARTHTVGGSICVGPNFLKKCFKFYWNIWLKEGFVLFFRGKSYFVMLFLLLTAFVHDHKVS